MKEQRNRDKKYKDRSEKKKQLPLGKKHSSSTIRENQDDAGSRKKAWSKFQREEQVVSQKNRQDTQSKGLLFSNLSMKVFQTDSTRGSWCEFRDNKTRLTFKTLEKTKYSIASCKTSQKKDRVDGCCFLRKGREDLTSPYLRRVIINQKREWERRREEDQDSPQNILCVEEAK